MNQQQQPFQKAFANVYKYEQSQANNNNIPSQETVDLLTQISKYYEDAMQQTTHEGALETLKFLKKHYETEANFKQQLYINQLITMTNLSPLEKSTTLAQSPFNIGYHKDVFSTPSTTTITSTPQQQNVPKNLTVVNLREELYSLFIAPWELYYQNFLHSSMDETMKRQFLETIQSSRISLGVLMQIAEDADKESTKGSDLAQKLNSLNSNLHSIKLSRMEVQLKEMERQLEEEKKQNLKLTRA